MDQGQTGAAGGGSFRPERDAVDAIVEAARAKLGGSHPEASSPRFPFGIHHSIVRKRLRERSTRRHPRNSDVAKLLLDWARSHGGTEAYAWQGVAVAVAGLAKERETEGCSELAAEAAKALDGLPPFVGWAQDQIQMAAMRQSAAA